jgi:hypothetical protein
MILHPQKVNLIPHLSLAHHKLGFDRFGQLLSDNESNEKFIQILRKSFIRYIREGTLILEVTPTEIPFPKDAAPQELNVFVLFKGV